MRHPSVAVRGRHRAFGATADASSYSLYPAANPRGNGIFIDAQTHGDLAVFQPFDAHVQNRAEFGLKSAEAVAYDLLEFLLHKEAELVWSRIGWVNVFLDRPVWPANVYLALATNSIE